MPLARLLLITLLTLFSAVALANEGGEGGEGGEGAEAAKPTGPVISYYALEPDIITNYLSDSKTLGYVRLTVDLMAASEEDKNLLKLHDPLIRDVIIRILGSKNSAQIKSLASREELRKECETRVNDLLEKEAGKRAVKELLFTKFLYQ